MTPPLRRDSAAATFRRRVVAWTALFAAALGLAGCGRAGGGAGEGPGAKAIRVAKGGARTLGIRGSQPGLVAKPRAVHFVSTGEMIVIDRSGRIQRLTPEGEFAAQWRLPAWENGTPTGFAVDPRDDSLWVADTHYTRILHYSREGNLLGAFGERGTGPGQMIFPTDVAFDAEDQTLWISEYGQRNRILHFRAADGAFLGEWGHVAETEADLLRPQSLVVAPDGFLYVADAGRHRVWRFRRGPGAPEPVGAWGALGGEPGALKYPYSLALGPEGTLFVLEYGNSRVSHFTTDGRFLGAWGAPGRGPQNLHSPWGVASDARAARLLLADTNNDRLTLLTLAPESARAAAR